MKLGRSMIVVRLRFGQVPAARMLLSSGGDVEVVSPPEARADLAAVAAAVVTRHAQPAHEPRASRNVPGTVQS